ncbi:MAG: hypothetical protein LBF37_00025 [Rickettsiales bacterium]|jgi:hypothetical protein|nr:hypothetical protein [Rickettsiales bacterium]
MCKIKSIEVSEITPGTDTETIWEDLVNTYPNLNMSFGVELYGSPEHGNTTNIDDALTIQTFKKLLEMKFASKPNGYMPYKTAVHLNHGYVGMFKSRDFQKSSIWNIIDKNTDKVVYNFNVMTQKQKELFSNTIFFEFLKTRANSFYYPNTNYFMILSSEDTSDFIFDNIVWKKCNDIQSSYFKWIKSLVFEKNFDDWSPAGIDLINNKYDIVKSHIVPGSWCGGITPDNVKNALDVLNQKLDGDIERIDISARGGVMTDGKTDMNKVYELMKNANEWQAEFNRKNIIHKPR